MKVRRVIVGLETPPRDRAVIEAAARLAGYWEAELVGLFVENPDLLNFAALPFAQEVGVASGRRRSVNLPAMQRSVRALAAELEKMLAKAAGRVPVRWSFQVARGSTSLEILASAMPSDLVVANIPVPARADSSVPVQVVPAGDPEGLRAALRQDDCILVLHRSDDILVGETLRQLVGDRKA